MSGLVGRVEPLVRSLRAFVDLEENIAGAIRNGDVKTGRALAAEREPTFDRLLNALMSYDEALEHNAPAHKPGSSPTVGRVEHLLELAGNQLTTNLPWEGTWPIGHGNGAVYSQGGYTKVADTARGMDAQLIVAAVNLAEPLARDWQRMREALEWFASEEAWEVTPSYATDGKYCFNTTRESIYATPWGFARDVLAAVSSGEPNE